MAIEGIFYISARVSDLERAKRFYRDTLGWQLHTDESAVAGFAFGTGYLVAHQDKHDSGEQRPAGSMFVALRVTDIEAEHARLTQHGVAVSAIHERPWGERTFTFNDPDGYLWQYGQAR